MSKKKPPSIWQRAMEAVGEEGATPASIGNRLLARMPGGALVQEQMDKVEKRLLSELKQRLDRIEGEGRVAFRYGEPVNGSQRDIAGVLNDAGNVLGMMPHPERMIEPAQGGSDGRALFESVLAGLGVAA